MTEPTPRRQRRELLGLAAALLAAGLVSGCTGDSGQDPAVIQPGAPGQPGRVVTGASTPPAAPAFTAADVRFIQQMIPHHQQALRMAELVASRTGRSDIPLLARRINVAQQDEIELMRRWLQARDQKVPDKAAGHGHGGGSTGTASGGEMMPGMLTEEQFAALERSRGTAFDRHFLTAMIHHHTGALRMVERLYADAGGQEPEINQIAADVDADQRIEIDRMQQLLAQLGGPVDL